MATVWTQISPPLGFGKTPFGDEDEKLNIHSRGFGEPTTKWEEHTGD